MIIKDNDRNLFIHLGPPKTGTTSFQNLLQELEVEEWYYGGTSQPRSEQKELSEILYSYCSGKNDDLKFVFNEIDEVFKNIKNIFISEEMFLVHQEKSSLNDKLKRLRRITENYNVTIIYVRRKINDVLPSYYQERYLNLPEEYQLNFNKFCYSEYCKAYDFVFIKQVLGPSPSYIDITFEKFIGKDQKLFDLTNLDLFKDISLSGHALNKSKISNDMRILTKKSRSEKIIYNLMLKKPKFLPSIGVAKHLSKFLSFFRKKEKKKLQVPNDILDQFQDNSSRNS